MTPEEALAEAIRELWYRGRAWEVLCDPKQADWIRRFKSGSGSYVWRHGRQRGKSFGALAMLDDHARSWPGSRTRYCALTIDTARAILGAAQQDLYRTCPEELRPVADGDDLVFPSAGDSRIIVMGTDATTFRRGRGFSRIERDVRDESQSYQDFDGVGDALDPGTQVPGMSGEMGRTLYMGTPAESPAHPYSRIALVHRARGAFELETFYDNPRVNPEAIIKSEMERTGLSREDLLASTRFRREYLSEDVTESSRAAIPSWSPEMQAKVVEARPRPAHFDGYSSFDWGYIDGFGGLYAYWDFAAAVLVIEDETLLRQKTTLELADDAKRKERALWGTNRFEGTLLGAEHFEGLPEWMQPLVASAKDAPRQPYLRVGDDDALVLADLLRLHGLAVLPTRKDDKALAVNEVDIMMRALQIRIHPRCVNLIRQLYATLWNLRRTAWERTPEGHGELIDCLVYLVRNVRRNRDPRPPAPVDAFQERINTINQGPQRTALARAFGVRR